MKNHSTVSRKDFLKSLGLGVAGVSVATAVAPAFRDLDDAISSPAATSKRPWWVKDKAIPTIEIDWDITRRFDARYTMQAAAVRAMYVGTSEVQRISESASKIRRNDILNNEPGHTHKDYALAAGSQVYSSMAQGYISFNGYKTNTPQDWGVLKYEGTPEENSKMIRSALTFFGAGQVGFMEITQKEKDKLFYTHNRGSKYNDAKYIDNYPAPPNISKRVVFENIDVGYEGEEKFAFPNNVQLYDIVISVPMSQDMFRTAERSQIFMAANVSRYRQFVFIQNSAQAFIRALGYNCYGYPVPGSAFMPSQASAILSGLAEAGRSSNFCCEPEGGPVNGFFSLVTDLPLAPTTPIDAGMWRFCNTCIKCAELCPANSLKFETEPSWEVPLLNGKYSLVHSPGRRLFYHNPVSCNVFLNEYGGCGACMAHCSFNNNGGGVNGVIKSVLSSTSLMDGFLAEVCTYSNSKLREDKESWWDGNYPIYGINSMAKAKDGA